MIYYCIVLHTGTNKIYPCLSGVCICYSIFPDSAVRQRNRGKKATRRKECLKSFPDGVKLDKD